MSKGKIKEALELLRRLEVFDCGDLDCDICPLDTGEDCYSNQALNRADWYREKSPENKTLYYEVYCYDNGGDKNEQ